MASPFTVDQPFKENNVINESERDATPANDVGKLVQLESNGKFSPAFLGFSGCLLKRTQAIAVTGTVFAFTTEEFDTENYHDNATNNERITIPTSGYYRIDASGYLGIDTDRTVELRVYKNGSTILDRAGGASGSTSRRAGVALSFIEYLVAGDYIELRGQLIGGTTDIVSRFGVNRVG